MPVSSSIYQFLNPGAVAHPDGLGSFRQGYTIGSDLEQQRQNSLLGQMRLAELQRQQQVEEQTRAAFREAYSQPATPAPGAIPVAPDPVSPYGAGGPLREVDRGGMPTGAFPSAGAPPAQPGASMMPSPLAQAAPGAAPVSPYGAGPGGLAGVPAGVDRAGLARKLYQIDPKAGMTYEKESIEREKSRFDLLEKQNDLVASTARSILQDDTQAGYERGVAYLRSVGIPVDHLPRYYDRKMVEQYAAWSTDTKTQLARERLALDTLQEQRLGEAEKRQQGEFGIKLTEEERKAQEAAGALFPYVPDTKHNIAINRRMQAAGLPRGSQPPAAILAGAEQDVLSGAVDVSAAQGAEKARLELEAKPLEGEAAKAVSELTTLQTMTDDVTDLFDPSYTGQFEGRWGAIKQWAGQTGQREVVFRRVVQDMKDQLLRARSGAAITQQEYERLSGLVPNVTDADTVFQAKLLGFRRALDQAKQARLQTATTSRGQLRGEQPGVTPLPGAGTKTITEADITATMEAQAKAGTPKTRQQIIDDAHQKGFTLQGT